MQRGHPGQRGNVLDAAVVKRQGGQVFQRRKRRGIAQLPGVCEAQPLERQSGQRGEIGAFELFSGNGQIDERRKFLREAAEFFGRNVGKLEPLQPLMREKWRQIGDFAGEKERLQRVAPGERGEVERVPGPRATKRSSRGSESTGA